MLTPLKAFVANERGMATLETVPLLIIFVVLIAFSLGSFGIIHSGILQSIGARNYAFETFRHRANLTYLRDRAGSLDNYRKAQNRVHSVMSEVLQDGENLSFYATERSISMGLVSKVINRDRTEVHIGGNDVAYGVRNRKVEMNPVWVIVQYGICLNVQCGD